MSETCIVCLGDLGGDSSNLPLLSLSLPNTLPRPEFEDDPETPSTIQRQETEEKKDSCLIAHLLPCGHNLHNDCLAPWVERANSCPICRQNFNSVELSNFIGGPVLSTYDVQDRIQEAEIDPSMLVELEEDPDTQPCQICREDDNEDVLMYCDNCNKLYHTYCVNLPEVPRSHWFCEQCTQQRLTLPFGYGLQPQRGHRPPNRRTRGQQRRYRIQNHNEDHQYNQVWREIMDRINVDLDDPFGEDDPTATAIRRQRAREECDRREFQAWQRRARIAELQGGANNFRDTGQALFGSRHEHPHGAPSPEPESLDEARAWRAFERASGDSQSTLKRRKRKSATASPVEPEASFREGRVKRPRVRRPQDLNEASDSAAESSSGPRSTSASSPTAQRYRTDNVGAGPSFLQSLLKEVEDSPAPNQSNGTSSRQSVPGSSPSADHTPRPSSPVLSTVSSNHSSPRVRSPSPVPRHSSLSGLTSSIQPIYPAADADSRNSPEPTAGEASDSNPERLGRSRPVEDSPPSYSRVPPWASQSSPQGTENGKDRSNGPSSPRAAPSFNVKSDVQKMVSTALKPFYAEQTLSKAEFTNINRDVSRMLYERVGAVEDLDAESKSKWEKMAMEEVGKAISSLKTATDVGSES
ncbi:MAG: hypothetical protein Q9227_003190 [Pyrenula ochraceoflavens]